MRRLDELLEKMSRNSEGTECQTQESAEQATVDTAKSVMDRKLVYFLDLEALIHYAGPLYAGFLVEKFAGSYIVPGEDNVYITDQNTLEKLKELETRGESGIYTGYKAFIERNFIVIPRKTALECFRTENTYRRWVHGTVIAFETEPCATVFGSLYYLYDKRGLEPLLVTKDLETARIAGELGFRAIDNT